MDAGARGDAMGGQPVTVHFVGAGPGAADLLTLRAAGLLAEAEVVLYPGTYLDEGFLVHVSPDAELVDTQDLDLDQIMAVVLEADREGFEVVRLVSGDPSVYSALSEQTRRLDEAGVAWDVTPGVPAYAAAAARVGRELTVPAGRAVRRTHPGAGALHGDAGDRGAAPFRGDPRHARAAPGDHAHP